MCTVVSMVMLVSAALLLIRLNRRDRDPSGVLYQAMSIVRRVTKETKR